MKILQLNVWTGRMKGTLIDFFKENNFDVICLQEAVWCDKDDLLGNFTITLDQIKEFSGLKYDFRSANFEVDAFNTRVFQGNAILSREKLSEKNVEIVHGKFLELNNLKDIKKQGYTLQMVKLPNGLNIVNHHGYWLPTPLGDDKTVAVMKKVAADVKNLDGPVVMCGDLNISYESPAMRELDFLHDLTHKNRVKNTLNGLKFTGKVACDHILVSDLKMVKKFKVLDDLISDHKGLVVEI